jgi:hypothetical protein
MIISLQWQQTNKPVKEDNANCRYKNINDSFQRHLPGRHQVGRYLYQRCMPDAFGFHCTGQKILETGDDLDDHIGVFELGDDALYQLLFRPFHSNDNLFRFLLDGYFLRSLMFPRCGKTYQ